MMRVCGLALPRCLIVLLCIEVKPATRCAAGGKWGLSTQEQLIRPPFTWHLEPETRKDAQHELRLAFGLFAAVWAPSRVGGVPALCGRDRDDCRKELAARRVEQHPKMTTQLFHYSLPSHPTTACSEGSSLHWQPIAL